MKTVQTRTLSGHITSTGVCDQAFPVSVGVNKTGTGVYVVTVPPDYRVISVTAITDSSGGVVVDVNTINDKGYEARTFLSSTGAASDWGHRFNIQAVA